MRYSTHSLNAAVRLLKHTVAAVRHAIDGQKINKNAPRVAQAVAAARRALATKSPASANPQLRITVRPPSLDLAAHAQSCCARPPIAQTSQKSHGLGCGPHALRFRARVCVSYLASPALLIDALVILRLLHRTRFTSEREIEVVGYSSGARRLQTSGAELLVPLPTFCTQR